jgi:F-type H+-transporting ATPase subunit b
MKKFSLPLAFVGTPALAATEPFLSLSNTHTIVLIAFLVFVGVLIYLKVPGLLVGLLDKRSVAIRAELDEAKALHEEAQTILASYERKQREVVEQSERIIAHARQEAQLAAEQAKEDLKASMARRIKAAEDQIGSAQAKVLRDVRDQAISVAIAASREVIAKQMTAASGNKLVDEAIQAVQDKLH